MPIIVFVALRSTVLATEAFFSPLNVNRSASATLIVIFKFVLLPRQIELLMIGLLVEVL